MILYRIVTTQNLDTDTVYQLYRTSLVVLQCACYTCVIITDTLVVHNVTVGGGGKVGLIYQNQ